MDATPPDAPLFRLLYRSRSRIEAANSRTELGGIFTVARRNNKRLGVTGALMMSGDGFVQALEGDETVVRDLYATICADPRHTDLTTLREDAIPERAFGRWAMAEVGPSGRADIRLVSNAKKGVIVAAGVVTGVDATVTPEQETVLALMREALALSSLEQ